MKPDDPSLETWLEPELEARLVALTGGATFLNGQNLLEVADALGADETLHKPLGLQQLRDCLGRMLNDDQPS